MTEMAKLAHAIISLTNVNYCLSNILDGRKKIFWRRSNPGLHTLAFGCPNSLVIYSGKVPQSVFVFYDLNTF